MVKESQSNGGFCHIRTVPRSAKPRDRGFTNQSRVLCGRPYITVPRDRESCADDFCVQSTLGHEGECRSVFL